MSSSVADADIEIVDRPEIPNSVTFNAVITGLWLDGAGVGGGVGGDGENGGIVCGGGVGAGPEFEQLATMRITRTSPQDLRLAGRA